MRRRGALLIGILLLIMLSACGQNQEQEMQEGTETSKSTFAEKENAETSEETEMKLYFDDKEILVKWEKCKAVEELQEEVQRGEITVNMSMYGDWEQVGSLGRSYTRSDKQMTAVSGDIVLYSGNQIVVFYGSNSWSYTKLGNMELTQDELEGLLSNGDITLSLRK